MNDDDIRRAYVSGFSMPEICEQYGLTYWKVRVACKNVTRSRTEGLRIRWKDMPNEYSVKDDVTELYLKHKGESYTVLFDTEDLERVKSVSASWVLHWNPTAKALYVKVGKRVTNTYTTLHRWIMDAKPNTTVDHINNNPLDNRKCNLRIVDRSINSHNSLKRIFNSGVKYIESKQKYRARITIRKKVIILGYFETEEEARQVFIKEKLKAANLSEDQARSILSQYPPRREEQ